MMAQQIVLERNASEQLLQATKLVYKATEWLMVEDNPGDIRISQEYFKEIKLANRLTVVKDEAEALSVLRGQGQVVPMTLPAIILISIAVLWRTSNGLLMQIKQDIRLKHIPVVILTAFEGEEASLDDDLPINLCVAKPLNLDCLTTIAKHFGQLRLTMTRNVCFETV